MNMKKFIYIFILSTMLPTVNHVRADVAPGMCVAVPIPKIPIGNLSNIESIMGVIQKEEEIEYATEDMADFCRRNFILRFLNNKKSAPSNCSSLPLKALEKLADDKIEIQGKNGIDSWELSLISTENSRRRAINKNMNSDNIEKYGPQINYDFTNVKAVSNDEYTSISNKLKYKIENSKQLINSTNQEMMKTVACAKTALLSIISCKSSLDFIEKIVTPKDFQNTHTLARILTPDAWLNVYKNNKLDNALIALAKDLQETLKKDDIDKNRNIFGDLNNSFISSGLSKEEATEASFQVLAIISNGGPNTNRRITGLDLEALPKSSAIAFLSQAMGALDYLKQKSGYPLYSYPSEIKSKCDYAKPYHFWMSAYLSRELVKNKIANQENAPIFTFLAQKGYQLNRDVIGDGGKQSKVLNAEPFGPIKQIIRLDLSFAAAGSVFGANQNNNLTPIKQIDVDRATLALLKKAHASTSNISDSASFLEKYSVWSEQFAPDEALDALK